MGNDADRIEMAREVTPITWLYLPYWAYRTAGSSWRAYQSKHRSLSVRRALRLLVPDLRRPIFLVGAPRSGTTFLGSCLGALPEVSYHFEPVATKAAARYVYEGRWSTAKTRWFYRNVYSWLLRLHLDGDLAFSEKTPRNAFIIRSLHRCFPDARFIHIIRDGRDAALSLSKRPWLQAAQRHSGRREPGGYRYGPYARFWVEADRIREFETTSDIHRCIWSWRRHTEAALEAAGRLPRGQYHELRYEQLVANPREEADRILEFLRIADPQSRALFHEVVARATVDSVGRGQRELSSAQLTEITQEAGPLLRKLGYGHRECGCTKENEHAT